MKQARRWDKARRALREHGAAVRGGMRGREDFWSDFAARAALAPQQDAAPAPNRHGRLVGWSTAAGAAVCALLVAIFLPAGGPASNRIESLEVSAAHSGVFILDAADQDATIVWIAGME
jgi:hypothetical protein